MARIAFLGLGRMGSGMAARLLDHGHVVSVYNRTGSRARPLAARGARPCASPREACTGVDAIFSMVADDGASRAMWLGSEGALAAQAAPAALAVECSTLSHAWALERAAACRARGLRPVDAPVTGLPDAAARGTLTLLVGADGDDLRAAGELFGALATQVFHFGPVGAGTTYKLLVNLIGAIQIASAAEGLALAERAGLDVAQVAKALASGQAASPQVVRHVGRMAGVADAGDVAFTSALRSKDVAYANALYRDCGMPSALGLAVGRLYEQLCASGRADASESTIIEVFRSRAPGAP